MRVQFPLVTPLACFGSFGAWEKLPLCRSNVPIYNENMEIIAFTHYGYMYRPHLVAPGDLLLGTKPIITMEKYLITAVTDLCSDYYEK